MLFNDDSKFDDAYNTQKCPNCGGTEIVEEKTTLRFETQVILSGKLKELGVENLEHKNFSILRCVSCNQVLLSHADLIRIMPGLANTEFEVVQVPLRFGQAHELN